MNTGNGCGVGGRIRRTLNLGFLLFGIGLAAPAVAATSIFLKIDNLDGESRDDQFKNYSDVLRFADALLSASLGATGKPSCVVALDKYLDRISPPLAQAALTGQTFATAKIVFRKSGDRPFVYYQLTLSNVQVQSLQQSGDPVVPVTESLSFTFSRADIEYTPQKDDGSAGAPVTATVDCNKLK